MKQTNQLGELITQRYTLWFSTNIIRKSDKKKTVYLMALMRERTTIPWSIANDNQIKKDE